MLIPADAGNASSNLFRGLTLPLFSLGIRSYKGIPLHHSNKQSEIMYACAHGAMARARATLRWFP